MKKMKKSRKKLSHDTLYIYIYIKAVPKNKS